MAHLLKIELAYSEPKIIRKIIVPEKFSFHELHIVIQNIMNWENYHLYQFNLGRPYGSDQIKETHIEDDDDEDYFFGQRYQSFDSHITMIGDYFNHSQKSINYIYDFGDDWIHTIKALKKPKEEVETPICVSGENSAPVEDCGGMGGFYAMIDELNQKKKSEEKEELREWLGLTGKQKYDDEFGFDIEKINETLGTLFN